jgi:hypothetical protein
MIPEITLALVALVLLGNNILLMKKINDLINKLMSKDYMDYTRAKVLEEEVKATVQQIKEQPPEAERF